MVVNEKLSSQRLDEFVSQQWDESGSRKHFPLRELKIQRKSVSPAVLELIRQDHVAFWNHKFKDLHHPLAAILITDTGNSNKFN